MFLTAHFSSPYCIFNIKVIFFLLLNVEHKLIIFSAPWELKKGQALTEINYQVTIIL